MRALAQKQQGSQQASSGTSSPLANSHSGHHIVAKSLPDLQRMIGNQAMQRMPQAHSGPARQDGRTRQAARYDRDFGRSPVYVNRTARTNAQGLRSEAAEPKSTPSHAMRAEYPVDFVGPLQPGDTYAVPYDFVGPLQKGVIRSNSFHPTMTLVTPGKATSRCGGFEHKVKWGVPSGAATAAGWIIQRVDINFGVTDCSDKPVTPHAIDNPANYPFWEAWEFTRGGHVWVGPASARTPHSGDTFSGSDYGAGTKGSITLSGEVKGIVGFTLPAGMTVRNAAPAWSLPYTRTEPAQFASTLPGAAHVVKAEWNCCPSGKVTKATKVTATP